MSAGRFREAEAIYRQVLARVKNDGRALWGLGRIAHRIGKLEQAIVLLEAAANSLPREPYPLLSLVDALNDNHRESDALTVLEHARDHAHPIAQTDYLLGLQYLMLGRTDDALTAFRRCLNDRNNRVFSFALYEVSRLKSFSTRDDDFVQIESALDGAPANSTDAMRMSYALGKACDDLGDYQTAFAHLARANSIQLAQCDFRTKDMKTHFDAVIEHSNALLRLNLEHGDAGNPAPIFIVGLPRSGSTLLEQMLSRHSQIAGAGETKTLSNDVIGYLSREIGTPYPQLQAALTPSLLQIGATIYGDAMTSRANGCAFVVDKALFNFQSIGLIYRLFPNAKVIHLRRDIRAIAWSVYKNYFAENEPYFCDLEEFKCYAAYYERLIAHWKTTFPGCMHEVSYENLVTDPRACLENLLAFCGLEFEPQCLEAQLGEGVAVHTLSAHEVRAPLHSHSLTRWKPYEQQLTKVQLAAATLSEER